MSRKHVLDISSSTLRRRARASVDNILRNIQASIEENELHASFTECDPHQQNNLHVNPPAEEQTGVQTFDENEDIVDLETDEHTEWPTTDPPPLDTDSDGEAEDDPPSLEEELANWHLHFGISLVALTALLGILRAYFPDLPKDARTLLKTRTTYTIQEKAGGFYFHFGILSALKGTLLQFKDTIVEGARLRLQISIDGLPLFKSSGMQLWPILGLLLSVKMKEPVVIGVFAGNKKPSSSVDYLEDFVVDLKQVETGFLFEGKQLSIMLASVICDTPARSFVKNTKSHNGYYGCDKCCQPGEYVNHRMTYPINDYALRTDESFLQMKCEEHHMGPITLQGVSVGFVSQFPLDYMHLVCLGVVRRLLNIWLKGPLKSRLPARLVNCLSDSLIGLRKYIPTEFARKPRSVRELDRWKATEFRQFLLYTGPVVLLSILDNAIYNNFMLFFAGISILVCPKLSSEYTDYASTLLNQFVTHYGEIYGRDMLVYNVHGLVHLTDDVKLHGCLDKFSSFPYENYLHKLKKLVRKPQFPLAQIVRRLSEQKHSSSACGSHKSCKKPHFSGPVPVGIDVLRQFGEMCMEDFVIKLTEGDNVFVIKNEICMITNIVECRDGMYVVYRTFERKSVFFNYPFQSSFLGIYCVASLSGQFLFAKVSDISYKCILLPFGEKFVIFPIQHTRK